MINHPMNSAYDSLVLPQLSNISVPDCFPDFSFKTSINLLLVDRVLDSDSFKLRSFRSYTDSEWINSISTTFENTKNEFEYVESELGFFKQLPNTRSTETTLRVNYVEPEMYDYYQELIGSVGAKVFFEEILGRNMGNDFRYQEYEGINKFFEQHKVSMKLYSYEYKLPDYDRPRVRYVCLCINTQVFRGWHLLQSIIPRLIPQFFERKPLTEIEKEYLESFTQADSSVYYSCLEALAKEKDIVNFDLDSKIQQLRANINTGYKTSLNSEINNCRTDIANYLESIARCYSIIDELQLKLVGLEQTEDTYENLKEYFKSNKRVKLLSVENHALTIEIKTYLDNFDPDLYEIFANNKNSELYRVLDESSESTEDRVLLFNAIFQEEKVKVRMTSIIDMAMPRSRQYVASFDARNHANSYMFGYMPNPHLKYYNCFGSDRTATIAQALGSGDFITAISNMISSTGNLNIGDGAVFPRFLDDLFRYDCIELPTGDVVSAVKAIEYLKGENNEQTN